MDRAEPMTTQEFGLVLLLVSACMIFGPILLLTYEVSKRPPKIREDTSRIEATSWSGYALMVVAVVLVFLGEFR